MKVGIFAKTYRADSVEGLFQKIRQHGMDQVHFNTSCMGLPPLPLAVPPPALLQQIKASAKANQLQLIGLSATFNMIHPEPEIQQYGLQSLEALAQIAQAIGIDFLSLCTGSRDPTDKWKWHPDNAQPDAWQDLLSNIEQAISIAEKYQLYLGIEPEMGNVVRNASLARRLLDEIQSDRLRVILDPANLFEQASHPQEIRDLIAEAIDLLYDNISIAHAKDRSLTGEIRAAGKGDVDFGFFMDQLRAIRFSGPLIMHALAEEEVEEAYAFLSKGEG